MSDGQADLEKARLAASEAKGRGTYQHDLCFEGSGK